MTIRPNRSLPRAFLWVALAGSLGVIAVGLIEHWNVALPIAGLIRFASWLVMGAYCSIPVLAIGTVVTNYLGPKNTRPDRVLSLAMSWAAGWFVIVALGILLLAMGAYTVLAWQILAPVVWLCILGWLVAARWTPITAPIKKIRASGQVPVNLLSWDGLLLLTAAVASLHASLPPDTRDEMAYHLVVPRMWANQGNWWLPADNFHLLFPGNTELMWGWAEAVSGLLAPRFITMVFAVLTVMMLSNWLHQSGVRRWIRLVCLVFFVVTPVALTSATICYVEWPLLFFLFLGWRCSRFSLDSDRADGVGWTAASWAMALGMKYTAAIFAGLLAIEWLAGLLRRRPKRAVVAALALAAATCVLAAPWLARNLVSTGDPVYPLGAVPGFEGNAPHDPATLSHYADIDGLWRWSPWFYHSIVDAVGDHRMHPMWPILLIAVILFGWRWRSELPWFAVVGSTAVLAWFTPAPRIYLPLMLLVWLFLPKILGALPDTIFDRWLASAATGLMVVVSLPIALHFMFAPGGQTVPDYLLGAIDTPRYLADRGLATPVTRWVAENTADEARLWAWCEDRTLYLERWARSDSPYGPPAFLDLASEQGADGLDAEIRDGEIDFVVLRKDRCPESWDRASFEKRSWTIEEETTSALRAWSADRLREIQRDDRYVLYKVRP